jgi:hypothetical protein
VFRRLDRERLDPSPPATNHGFRQCASLANWRATMPKGRLLLVGALLAAACGGNTGTAGSGGGGSQNNAAGNSGSGASASGGMQSGPAGAGGTSNAGSPSSGASGDGASGGRASGGDASGGDASGGDANGGDANGGDANGGASTQIAFIDELGNLAGCLPIMLPSDTNHASPTFGEVACQVVETSAGSCDCSKPGRAPVDPNLVTSIRVSLQSDGNCGASGQTACASFCMCEIVQESGVAATACKADPVAAAADTSVPAGFCYANDPASPALAQCPSNQKQKLLFVSPSTEPTPTPGSVLFLACAGS